MCNVGYPHYRCGLGRIQSAGKLVLLEVLQEDWAGLVSVNMDGLHS
jgi:hypothetical protein